ncbi:Geranylgeranylglyceryl phosphate synthase [Candidatus Burarchaeum australiense]|nr:Geranylgeranylglyceryl phosphate synthase [Candidatus Burarchaeum australiense]
MSEIRMGKVENYIHEKLASDGAMLFALIDPLDHKDVESAARRAKEACEAGADLLLIGGSMGVQGSLLDDLAKRVKESVNVPLVLFPGNISTLTTYADAVYYMSLRNSRNPYWITQAQMLAAYTVKKTGIEPLPVGYIVVEPGGTVGWVGEANLVPRDKPMIAAALALGAQYAGCRIVITDTGSAPAECPVPLDMVAAVRASIDVPYIVAGGIRKPEQARDIVKAGADAIQVGTAIEQAGDVKKTVGALVKAVKEEGRKRR